MNTFDYTLIDNVEVDGIDFADYPDFSDAYIVSADYNGREMTNDELDTLNQDGEYVLEKVFEKIY